ncbi:hypothetical protein [Rhizobium phage RHph_X3_2]|nr:hypothetical protein [Rhizobium phage RHph_X3_2]
MTSKDWLMMLGAWVVGIILGAAFVLWFIGVL